MQCGKKKKKKRERGREGSFILILHCNRPTKILVVQLWVVSIFFSWPVFYITLWWTCVSLWKHNYSENIGFNNSRNNKVILQVKTYIINTRKTPTPNTSIRLTPQPPWPPKLTFKIPELQTWTRMIIHLQKPSFFLNIGLTSNLFWKANSCGKQNLVWSVH